MTPEELRQYNAPPDLLRNRVILVTGAGDGIGRAAAETFARHGATVILLGRTVSKLETVYDAIEAFGGPQPAIYPINLEGAAPHDYGALAETLDREFGRLDGLLNNAALQGTLSPIEQFDPELWARVLQINLNAPFLLAQACLPLLRKADDASLVFTSAAVGRRGKAYWGAYAVSNFGVEGLMQVLADELENHGGIRVNSLDPGPVRTEMRRVAFPAEDPGSVPEPYAIMPAYLYLMGPDSREVHGRALSVQP